jgi:hypothetical protein
MDAGNTFLLAQAGTSIDSHFWMVTSDPLQSASLLIFNLTSWRSDKDQACILVVGDHPYIKHPSCVNYGDGKIVPVDELNRLKTAGLLKPREDLKVPVLAKVRNGAAKSTRIKLGHVQLLIDQGLIDFS